MKKLFFLIALILTTSVTFSQTWFQASLEHKLNSPAGLSISNEVGYNFMLSDNISISPSVDYTYFANGNTQTLLFGCVTLTHLFPIENCTLLPYVSITGTYLNTWLSLDANGPLEHAEKFGGSLQIGTGIILTKNTQLFLQHRYFGYGTLLYGHLTQFGFMYTFGG